MTATAHITSIDAVKHLKAAMLRFVDEASAALADLQMEAGRTLEWLKHGQKDYWANEIRTNYDRVSHARVDLERAQMLPSFGRQPTCYDEKKALDMARRRLETAQQKLDAVRRWARTIDREVLEFRAACNQLSTWLQVDAPKGVAVLDRMFSALETYAATHLAATELPPLPASSLLGSPFESAAGGAPGGGEPVVAESPPEAASTGETQAAAMAAPVEGDRHIFRPGPQPEVEVGQGRKMSQSPDPQTPESAP